MKDAIRVYNESAPIPIHLATPSINRSIALITAYSVTLCPFSRHLRRVPQFSTQVVFTGSKPLPVQIAEGGNVQELSAETAGDTATYRQLTLIIVGPDSSVHSTKVEKTLRVQSDMQDLANPFQSSCPRPHRGRFSMRTVWLTELTWGHSNPADMSARHLRSLIQVS